MDDTISTESQTKRFRYPPKSSAKRFGNNENFFAFLLETMSLALA